MLFCINCKTIQNILPNTALLIFTRSASLEACQKPLAFRKKSAQKVAQLLNNQVFELAKSTGLQYFIVNEELQRGSDFASRLESAFQYVFAKGFDRVISIGNDCLGLTKAQILTAAADLQEKDLVIGPTQQGGLYLFGLNASTYQQLDFQALPWQTNKLYTSLEKQVTVGTYLVKTYVLCWEVNHIYEWHTVFQQVKKLKRLIARLNTLLQVLEHRSFNYLAPQIFSFLFQIQQRGPPRI